MSLQRQYGTEISSEIEYQTFAFIVAYLFAYESSMGADIVAKIWAYKDSMGADIVAKIWAYKDSMGRKFHQKLSTKPLLSSLHIYLLYESSMGANIVANLFAYEDSMGRKFHQKLSTKPYVAVFRVPNLMLLFSEYQNFAFIVAILVAILFA